MGFHHIWSISALLYLEYVWLFFNGVMNEWIIIDHPSTSVQCNVFMAVMLPVRWDIISKLIWWISWRKSSLIGGLEESLKIHRESFGTWRRRRRRRRRRRLFQRFCSLCAVLLSENEVLSVEFQNYFGTFWRNAVRSFCSGGGRSGSCWGEKWNS